jgi:quercetin dioxygenase-like cupin family protein
MGTGRGGELFTNFRHHAAKHNGRWRKHCMASRRPFVWPLTGALLAVALLLSSADRGASREVVSSLLSTTQTILGQPIAYPTEAPAKVAAAIVTMLPGEETGWHQHDVPMFGYILEGEVTVDYGAKGTRVYRQGEVLVEAVDIPHNGRNSGMGAARILSVFMGAEGVPNTEMLPKHPLQ